MTVFARTVFLIFALLIATGKLICQNCEKLIHYRDVELVMQFDNAKKKYVDKYKLGNEAIADMKKIKTDLLNERGWDELMSTGTAMSKGGVTVAQIARLIKTYCDLILGLAEMMPAENVAAAAIKEAKLTGEQAYKLLKSGKDLKEIVEGNLEKVATKNVLDESGLAGKAAKTGLEFYENLDEFVKIPEEREKLKSEVERILDLLDNAVYKYQQDLEKSKEKLKDILGIEQGITKYLNENCKDITDKKDLKNSPKKEPGENKILPAKTEDKKVSGSAFYIFFSANLSVNGKFLTVISAPALYHGMLTDAMIDYKEDFIKQVERQLPNKPKDFKEILSKNEYETISVHYSKPYSTTLLKSVKDGFDAIESFKQSMKDAVDGLPHAELIDFFQLN
jgi:hypothetical protein